LEDEMAEEYYGKTLREISESRKTAQKALKDTALPPEQKAEVVKQTGARVEAGLARLPQNARLSAEAAEFSFAVSDYRTGMERAERSVSLAEARHNPKQLSAALTVRGRGHSASGDFPRALADADAALIANPNNQAAFALKMLSEGRAKTTSPPRGEKPGPGQQDFQEGKNPPAPSVGHPEEQVLLVNAAQTAKDRAAASLIGQSVAAEGIGDHERAVVLAEKALSLCPQNPSIRQMVANLKESLAKRKSQDASAFSAAKQGALSGQAKPGSNGSPSPRAEKMGSSSFIRGFQHYLGRGGTPLWIDFSEVDTKGVRVSRVPAIASELRKPARDAVIPIESRLQWETPGLQAYLIGRITLRVRGTLTLRRNCTWAFHGSLGADNDIYDFDESNRSFVAETLTAVGRNLPGKAYDIEIRGTKPISDNGSKESCP
jgi:tetratricopeptide (TPR) repeat protein